MHLKGILFDFDGVVVKSMEYHLKAWKYAFKNIGVDLEDNEFYLQEGRGVKSVAETLVKKHHIQPNLIQQIIDTKIEYFDKINSVEFYDGFFDLLKFLKSQSIAMAIVTGGFRTRVNVFVNDYLDGYFSAIVCSDDVDKTKPSPEPYIKGMKKLRLDPDECLVIENAPLGIQAAKAAGLKVIAIETTLDKNFLSEADHVTQSFSEIQSIIENYLHKKVLAV